MPAAPSFSGTFDQGQSPTIKVCALSGSACGSEVVAFAMGSGTNGIKVSTSAQSYSVTWQTQSNALTANGLYRIRVLIGTALLGYADVKVVNNQQQMKNVTSDYVGLVRNAALTIAFRIEVGAASSPIAVALYDDYRATAPHYQHISMMVTEWRISGDPTGRVGEYDWLLAHYDHLMGARTADVKSRMPSVTNIPYALYLSVIQPNTGEPDQIASVYYNDMVAWYAQHTQHNIESAFLHNPTGGITASNRLVAHVWTSDRWFTNVGDAGARAYHADRLYRLMNLTPGYPDDGVFIDEHDGGSIARMFPSAEYADYDATEAGIVGILQSIKARLGQGKIFMLNTAESTSPNTISQVTTAGATHLEQMNNPMREMRPRWKAIESMLSGNVTVQLVTGLTDTDYNSPDVAAQGWTAGNEATPAARGRMFELASYYMVLTTPSKVWLTTYNGAWGTLTFPSNWVKAIEANIGTPTGARAMYQSGLENGRNYEVWQRPFTRALVLARPDLGWRLFGDNTAVSLPLPAGETWYVLRTDGTLTAPVTSVTLRNGEGVIAIKGSAF